MTGAGAGPIRLDLRPARQSDREPLMSFIRHVWGGHDYIPRVWEDWIRDASAKMFVVEADGVPVAMNRVRLLEDGSAWFEGARVHPDYRRLGLASRLGANAMEVAAGEGATVFRLTSGSRNRASHRQVGGMGFGEVSRFSVYEPSGGRRFRARSGVKVAGDRDLALVTRSIKGSREYTLAGGVMWDGFAAMSLTPRVIANRLEEGSVYQSGGAVAIRRPGREGEDVWNQIGFLAGEPEAALRVVDTVFAAKGDFDWRFVMVPQGSPLVPALRRHGLRRSFSNVLFEKKAAKG